MSNRRISASTAFLPSSRCQLSNLTVQRAALRSRHHRLFRSRRGQCALRGQPPPTKRLVRRYSATARHQADRDTRFFGLGHDRQRVRRRSPAGGAPLARSGPLFGSVLVINTTLLLPLIEVGELVRSIKGPLHVMVIQRPVKLTESKPQTRYTRQS